MYAVEVSVLSARNPRSMHAPVSIDPLCPLPPEAPYFDAALEAWVLSRYADVSAAFRDTRMAPTGPRSNKPVNSERAAEQARIRRETLAALSAPQIAAWEEQMAPLAHNLLSDLDPRAPLDLVRDFALPWSLGAAVIVTGAEASDGEYLTHLSRQVSASAADPFDSDLQSKAAAASDELERLLAGGTIPMRAATFVALSQTLPSFLANAWLALLRNPAESARLRDQPDLMPGAMDELLRYAGLARMLFRHATGDLVIGSLNIAEGERIVLMLASANRDPLQFAKPDRLDLTRRPRGQFALGFGSHACVGAALIRMAASVATEAFVSRFAEAVVCGPIEWRGGPGFRSPKSLMVAIP